MNKTQGIVVLAQNTYQNPDLKLQYEGIHVDVWYQELAYLEGQHVWYKNDIYRAIDTVTENTEFSEKFFKLTIKDVKLYSDKNKYLEYAEIFTGDLVLNDNKIYLVNYDGKTNYVDQACLLAMSISKSNPGTKISIITNDSVPKQYVEFFDKIIPIPWGDDAKDSEWKIENRWKIYHSSPYDRTIVMDTDMIVLQDISSWWSFLSNYDLFFTTKVLTYRGELVTSDYYRKTFTNNGLLNLYAGLHYFEKSELASTFYKWMKYILYNWKKFYRELISKDVPAHPSIDVISSLVAKILDCEEQITNNKSSFPTFVHLKPNCQNWAMPRNRWQEKVSMYITNNLEIKIGNYKQTGILHYTEKDLLSNKNVLEKYRNMLNV